MRTIKEALEDGSISLEDEIDYPDMTEEEYKDKEIERLKTELQDTKEHLGEFLHEQEEENKRLNNIIEEYKNANEYHQKIIHELETMKQPNQLHSENVKLRIENNRLNNIINELEKYIDNEIEKLEKKIFQATKEEDTFGYSCALGKYEIEQKLDVLYDVSIELGKFERAKR